MSSKELSPYKSITKTNQSICANCDYCLKKTLNEYIHFHSDQWKCSLALIRPDYVSGDHVYGFCKDINENGDCSNYKESLPEVKVTFWRTFWRKIKIWWLLR